MSVKILGIEGKSVATIQTEVSQGGKFVFFPFSIGLIVMSFKRSSPIFFLPPDLGTGEVSHSTRLKKGFPYALISFFLGWWGIPHGLIWTIQNLYTYARGGKDVTADVMASLTAKPAPPPAPVQPENLTG